MRSNNTMMNMTLDGVIQGLGRQDEDTRGGFVLGGWGAAHRDEELGGEIVDGLPDDMLFGRHTWQDSFDIWADATQYLMFIQHPVRPRYCRPGAGCGGTLTLPRRRSCTPRPWCWKRVSCPMTCCASSSRAAIRRDLLARLGRASEARSAFEAAAALTDNERERTYVLARRDDLR